MSSKQSILVTAKSINHALKNAAKELATSPDNLEYELISQTDAGLLSFLGGKRVEIKVWKKASETTSIKKQPQKNQHSEEAPAAALTPQEQEKLVEDLKSFCAGICAFIAAEPVKVSAKLDSDRLALNIENDELAHQIGKNARLAESLEHVLRKKPRYLKRELPFRIFVDANGIRSQRENELIEMAQDLSFKVAENQRPIVLNYKSSYDRKIIHMALDKDERVYTKSIGSGANRKLMILPVKHEHAEENRT